MGRKRHTPEQIIAKLREAEVELAKGQKTAEVWAGTGSCHFPGISVLDPWHSLPVKNMVGAARLVADFVLPDGKILETL